MAFDINLTDDVLIVKMTTDRATVDISGKFKDGLLKEIEKGNVNIVVDMDKAEYVDSSFLGALVAGLKRATMKNGDLKLVHLQPAVRSMFDLTRLYRIFDIFDKLDEAVKSYQ